MKTASSSRLKTSTFPLVFPFFALVTGCGDGENRQAINTHTTGGSTDVTTAAATGLGGNAGKGDFGGAASTTIGNAGSGAGSEAGSEAGGHTAAGGSTGTSTQRDPCVTPPESSLLVGWASVAGSSVETTTGGGSAKPVVVSNLADLQNALNGVTPTVVYVSGVLEPGNLTVGSNKTIVGLCGAEIHGHVQLAGSVNVIVRNIKLVGFGVGDCALDPSYDPTVGCSSGADAVSVLNNAHHIVFDHCDISDGTDGNLDITNGSNFVTVAYTKFHYSDRVDPVGNDSTGASGHRYSNLVGGTDTPSYPDPTTLNVTWHHNWWADGAMQRMPRVRFGKNHVFNNLYTPTGNGHCVRAGIQAQILVENCAFVGVKNPLQFNNAADQATASITASLTQNLFVGTSGTISTGGGGTAFLIPPYAYQLDEAAKVQSIVEREAGPH